MISLKHLKQNETPWKQPLALNLKLRHASLIPGAWERAQNILLQGGKLIRPRILLMTGEGLGLDRTKLEPFARAAELVHAATLAHDDVIDQALTRRNQKTLPAVLTQSRSVLMGDLFLSRVVIELSEQNQPEVLRRMAEVVEDLVTGEWLQLEGRGQFHLGRAWVVEVARLKTGALFRWCFETPFRIANQKQWIELAQQFGTSLGTYFQRADDLLDFSSQSGKEYAKDLSEGLMNSVLVEVLESEPRLISVVREFFERPKQSNWAKLLEKTLGESFEQAKTKCFTQLELQSNELFDQLHSFEGVLDSTCIKAFEELILEIKRSVK